MPVTLMSDLLLDIRGLSVRYFKRGSPPATALHPTDLRLSRGETLGLVGQSGSGKSSLALALMRLLPPESASVSAKEALFYPEAGAAPIRFLEEKKAGYRGWGMGMIFQHPLTALNPVMRCGAHIEEALRSHQNLSNPQALRSESLALLAAMRLDDPERIHAAYPCQLSGGQLQRALLAAALACKPRLLIADEPTTALDADAQNAVLDLLVECAVNRNMALLLISHNLEAVARVCKRIAVAHQGRIVEEGPAAQIAQSPQHEYTRQLVLSTPQARTPRPAPSAPRTHTPLIEIRGGSICYADRNGRQVHTVCSELDLHIDSGEIVGLTGPSGSGKSSIARVLAGQHRLNEGERYYQGEEVASLAPARYKQFLLEVQMINQDPGASLNPRMRVGDAIAEPLLAHRLCADLREANARVGQLLEQVGLDSDYAARYPAQLSGGQRQRACIARALSLAPRLLICDEPTSSLDFVTQAKILDLLLDLRRRIGLSILLISHDIDMIRSVCDRIIDLGSSATRG
ncbi:MAG: ATP-binding cassette domain-containing protein [Saprospiraceae bacterium]